MTNDPNTDAEQSVDDDTVSDPARDDETGSDWSTEGGATDDGPATDTEGVLHGSGPQPPDDEDES